MSENQTEILQNKPNKTRSKLISTKILGFIAITTITTCAAVGIYELYLSLSINETYISFKVLFFTLALFMFAMAFWNFKNYQHQRSNGKLTDTKINRY